MARNIKQEQGKYYEKKYVNSAFNYCVRYAYILREKGGKGI